MVITDALIELTALFDGTLTREAQLRFYSVGESGPEEVLFDTGRFPLGPGAGQTLSLSGLSVITPPRFIWSIEFFGFEEGDTVGLPLYSPPSVGSGFTDFWIDNGAGWQLAGLGELNADFAALFIGFPLTNDGANLPPLGNDDFYAVVEGESFSAINLEGSLGNDEFNGVLVNDSDPESGPLLATVLTPPSYAVDFVFNEDGSFYYEHDGSESFEDSFVYAVSDGINLAVGQASISISPTNDNGPLFSEPEYLAAVPESTPVGSVILTVLAEDTDEVGQVAVEYSKVEADIDNFFDVNATSGESPFSNR